MAALAKHPRQAARIGCALLGVALVGCLGMAAWQTGAPAGAAGEDAGGAHASAVSIAPIPQSDGAYVPGQLIVEMAGTAVTSAADAPQAGASASALFESRGYTAATIAKATESSGEVLLITADDAHQRGNDLAQAAQAIAQVTGVASIQPNYRYATAEGRDPYLWDVADQDSGRQYYLGSWNDSYGANVADAWEFVDPSEKVDVAVLDTGIYSMTEYDEDDQGYLIDSANGHQEFDDDNLDMEAGRDFVHANNDELPLVNPKNPTGDDNGHGTHVSAIIAANAAIDSSDIKTDKLPEGIAGVSPCARIIPLKVLDASGEDTTASFIRAFAYLEEAVQEGDIENLHVINMSISLTYDDADEDETEDESVSDEASDPIEPVSGDGYFEFEDDPVNDPYRDSKLFRAIDRMRDLGVITVCAAGNDQSDAETYPSDYPTCVSVAALDTEGAFAPYTNLNEHKDIAAPGSDVYSAWATQADAYNTLSGTSQATAIVSGTLSMMWSCAPELTVQGAKTALYKGARKIEGSEEGAADGCHGALDAGASLELVNDVLGDFEDDEWEDEPWWGSFEYTPITRAKVQVSPTACTYTGKKQMPSVKVVLGGETLRQGRDYTVSYTSNVNPGTATVTVSGMGDYEGKASAHFTIKPKGTALKKLKRAKKSFTATWAKQAKQTSGYQLRYSLKRNMAKAKVKTVKKPGTTKLKVKKLKSKKRYFVQVRTYKKTGGKTYYSAWSKVKTVKTK